MRIRNISKKMVSLALTIAIIGTGSGISGTNEIQIKKGDGLFVRNCIKHP